MCTRKLYARGNVLAEATSCDRVSVCVCVRFFLVSPNQSLHLEHTKTTKFNKILISNHSSVPDQIDLWQWFCFRYRGENSTTQVTLQREQKVPTITAWPTFHWRWARGDVPALSFWDGISECDSITAAHKIRELPTEASIMHAKPQKEG